MSADAYAAAPGMDDPSRSLVDFPLRGDRLNAVFSAAAEGGASCLSILASGAGLRVTWANEAALAVLGWTADELTEHELAVGPAPGSGSAPAYGLTSGPDLADWSVVVGAVVRRSVQWAANEWHSALVAMPGCDPSPVQVLVRPASDVDYVVFLRPVTDPQRLAEEAQRRSEKRFAALAEHAPVGIVLSEAGVRLGFVNAEFAQIAGSTPARMLGTHWLNKIYPEDLPGMLEKLDEVLAGTAVEATVRLVSAVHLQRWVQFRLAPVLTARRSAGFIGTVEDITARHAWEAQLTYQAGHDSLTGLANRRSLVEALTDLLTSRRSRDRDAAVLFCDLDGFKQINDTLGHDAGDRVLIEVGQRLSAAARDHDLVARIAGDEFVVMIREVGGIADAESAAARQLLALQPPIRVAGQTVEISASIGIAMARDYDSATVLLQAADRGMYEAKRAGRGLYRGGALRFANQGLGE